MIYVAIVGSLAFLCSMLLVPLFWSVPRMLRVWGSMAGLAALSASLCFHGGHPRIIGEAGIGIFVALATRSAREAWRNFDDRRMVARAEAYQAQIDAERSAT